MYLGTFPRLHSISTLCADFLQQKRLVVLSDDRQSKQIRDNIALGDPTGAWPSSLLEVDVERAARLAGAEDFLGKLPKGLDTYLTRPICDVYSCAASGKMTASGRTINYDSLRTVAGVHRGGSEAGAIGLSGGQIQRLAV